MKKLTLIIALLLVSLNVNARQIGIIGGALHLYDQNQITNSNIHGAYINAGKYAVGFYKNSYSKNSIFINRESKLISHVYLDYGFISGYGWDSQKKAYGNPNRFTPKILPFVSPKISYTINNTDINLHLLGAALAFSISNKF